MIRTHISNCRYCRPSQQCRGCSRINLQDTFQFQNTSQFCQLVQPLQSQIASYVPSAQSVQSVQLTQVVQSLQSMQIGQPVKLKSCVLDCGYCLPGQTHMCRNCGDLDNHLTRFCTKGKNKVVQPQQQQVLLGSCVFNCGFCLPGKDHRCRNCGKLNDHRTVECKEVMIQLVQPQVQKQPVQLAPSALFTPSMRSVPHLLQLPPPVMRQVASMPPTSLVLPVQSTQVKNVGIYVAKGHKILICRRGVHGDMLNKVFGPGGEVDRNENPHDAAIRETLEEAGVDIRPYMNSSQCRVHNFGKINIYNIRVGNDCVVNGPMPAHRHEISRIPIVGYDQIGNTGWYWMNFSDAIIFSTKEHGNNHFFTKNLERFAKELGMGA